MLNFPTFPTIQLGPLTLHTFGLCVAVGVLLGAEVTARRNSRFGVAREETQRMVLWLVAAGLVGARLAWAATNWADIRSPLDVVAVWNGGMQFSGGFVAALAITPWVTRRLDVPGDTRFLLDSAAVGLAVGQLIGRLGCISVGEHLGGPTAFFLGWTYAGGPTREGPLTPGTTYHNTAIYEFLWLLPLIALLAWKARNPKYPGQVLIWLMSGYGALRFCTDALRTYDQRLWGLTGAQFMCLSLLIAAPVLARRFRRGPASAAADSPKGGAADDSGPHGDVQAPDRSDGAVGEPRDDGNAASATQNRATDDSTAPTASAPEPEAHTATDEPAAGGVAPSAPEAGGERTL
ncbi:MAG: prolipoprotein diacylglyceryl transferase [Actinomycetales bacterium]|nr:prolipoprotein diacylglyceryl transferase [Actinomycetales bacterium]